MKILEPWLRALFLILPFLLPAQQDKPEVKARPIPEASVFVSHHQINNGGKIISYTATASETYLKNTSGEPVASIWSVAYTRDGMANPADRPVSFVFNGGPGSASVWLHMGLLGPKRVLTDSDAREDDEAAPYKTVQNTNGILDLTDLVFIDPVGTGYSRVVGKGKVESYWGLTEDAASISKFMRQWITDNNRWNSPKYIIGESFGTTRAALVAHTLEEDGQAMSLNGLVLISQALDYAGSTSEHDNITSYLTYLPSMAAVAWYHKKAGQGKTLESFIEECRDFTYNTYAPALYKGVLLKESDRQAVASKLAYFTGLGTEYILKSDLRVLVPRFQKQLLSDKGLAIGRLDGRYTGDEIDDVAAEPHLGDPSSYRVDGAYTAALNNYLATELEVTMDRPYLTSNEAISKKWRWKPVPDGQYWEPSMVNVAGQLGETMRRNTGMKVMVAAGYYDLICPFFDTEYTFSRNGIAQDRVQISYYEAGHMMYLHEPDFEKVCSKIRAFLTQ
jgi:carboxypeptidase C (cathepsin A)